MAEASPIKSNKQNQKQKKRKKKKHAQASNKDNFILNDLPHIFTFVIDCDESCVIRTGLTLQEQKNIKLGD